MIDFLTPAELDKVLKAHRPLEKASYHPPSSQSHCIQGCGEWPCVIYRLAEEVRRRRDKLGGGD